jgi:hypothetical protein
MLDIWRNRAFLATYIQLRTHTSFYVYIACLERIPKFQQLRWMSPVSGRSLGSCHFGMCLIKAIAIENLLIMAFIETLDPSKYYTGVSANSIILGNEKNCAFHSG